MELNINDDRTIKSPQEKDLLKAIEKLSEDKFLVLSRDDNFYIQVYHHEDDSYQLEYRDGSADRHFAVAPELIDVADVAEAFCLFLNQSDELPSKWKWEAIDISDEITDEEDEEDEDDDEETVEHNGVMMLASWPQRIEEAQEITTVSIEGTEYSRVRFGAEKHLPVAEATVCGDCGVLPGQVHVPGCDIEECPRCQGQLCSCDCQVDQEEE